MLPYTNDHPAGSPQNLVGLEVSSSVGQDLRSPELGVGLGPRPVDRASMPEAAVYENGDPSVRKEQIGLSTQAGQWNSVDSVAEALPMDE